MRQNIRHTPSRSGYLVFVMLCFLAVAVFAVNRTPKRIPPGKTEVHLALPPCRQPATHIAPIPAQIKLLSQKFDSSFGVTMPPEELVDKTVSYKDISIKMTGANLLTAADLDRLKRFIDEVPQAYLNYRPWSIYTLVPEDLSDPDERDHAKTVSGFTSGANMYLLPSAFTGDYQGFRYLLYHEWMHIIQYYKIYEEIPVSQLESYRRTQIYQMGMFTGFFVRYATGVGWDNPSVRWRKLKEDTDSQKQTAYGKAHPVEDQAETAGYYLSGQPHVLSRQRREWMEQFLGCQ